jgi:hypothetical protein
MPSLLRAQGRDLHAEFIRLLPTPPRPIRIQRRSLRRVGLMAATAVLLVVAVGVAGAVRPFPAGRLVGGERGRQRRPLGDHPEPRPDRRPGDGGPADRRLRRRGVAEQASGQPGVRRYQLVTRQGSVFQAVRFDASPAAA